MKRSAKQIDIQNQTRQTKKIDSGFKISEILNKLVKQDWISHASAKYLLSKWDAQLGVHPLEFIVEHKVIDPKPPHDELTLEKLSAWWAREMGLEYVVLDPLKIDGESVTSVVPKAYAQRLGIFPIEVNSKSIIFAISNPKNLDWVEELKRVLKRKIQLKFANPKKIEQFINDFYNVKLAMNQVNTRAKETDSYLRKGKLSELDGLIERGRSQKYNTEDSAVAAIVDWLLGYAIEERASDIHLEFRRGMAQIRFRVDGVLRVVYRLSPEVMTPVLSRVKIMSDLKVDEHRRPQDGRLKRFLPGNREIELRVSTIPSMFGEKVVMRLFDNTLSKRDLERLGFKSEDVERWYELIFKTNGLLLVTGPTGSGKTTTLYSSMDKLSSPEVNICTVEDPIEMVNENYTQLQVNKHVNVNFSSAIRSFLRQDPDIIMVGEIRDKETAEMAFQASLTGHLVLSTLHTNGAFNTITRLFDLGVQPYLVQSSLLGVLAQRLIRVLCPNCKEAIEVDSSAWKALCRGYKLPEPETLYAAKGCHQCKQTGYHGRTVIYELLPMTAELRKHIVPGFDWSELERMSLSHSFRPMLISGIEKVISGETSIDEVKKIIG